MNACMPKMSWPAGSRYMLQPYRAKDGWRWRLWSRNGRLVAESGEAYKRIRDALKITAALNFVSGSVVLIP